MYIYEPHREKTGLRGFRPGPTLTVNRAVQPHKMDRSLKFCIKEVKGLYYCSHVAAHMILIVR